MIYHLCLSQSEILTMSVSTVQWGEFFLMEQERPPHDQKATVRTVKHLSDAKEILLPREKGNTTVITCSGVIRAIHALSPRCDGRTYVD